MGEEKRGLPATGFRGWAHSGQNFAVSVTWLPQLAQASASGAAHSSQNFAPVRFSGPHFEHFIGRPEAVETSRVTSVASRTTGNNAYVRFPACRKV